MLFFVVGVRVNKFSNCKKRKVWHSNDVTLVYGGILMAKRKAKNKPKHKTSSSANGQNKDH